MFKLFGKKKEQAEKKPEVQNEQIQAFAQRFLPEEFTILAVTGASGFGSARMGDDELWTGGIDLTAWMEENGEEIHRESARLSALGDEKLMGYLRQRLPRDFILKVRVRAAREGGSFQLIGLPEAGFDPDLKAILDEQKKPVSRYVEGLGTFTLERSVNWFQANVDWLGKSIQLTYDNGTEEDMKKAQDTARTLMADQAGWDEKVRALAAQELLEQANDWAQDGAEEGEAPEEITGESFRARMELETIQVCAGGGFELWFGDGDLFWGHSIHVSGNLQNGPTEAQMEG